MDSSDTPNKKTGQPPQWAIPYSDPDWRRAGEAGHMQPNDPVLGFTVQDRAFAIPWWIMKNHHAANLEIAGEHLMLALCEHCSSAAAYTPIINGRRHTFHMQGAFNGTHFLRDHQTKTDWASFSGEAIRGHLKGHRLTRRPLWQGKWSDWRRLHPDTTVAFGEKKLRLGHGSREFPGAAGKNFFSSLVSKEDKRLPHNAMVLGVKAAAGTKAYPLAELDTGRHFLNDDLDNHPIALFYRPGTLLAMAFSRASGGETLEFTAASNGDIQDRQTGSHWNLSGKAVSGPMAGTQLEYIFSGVEEWYIWAAYNPGTLLYRGCRLSRFKTYGQALRDHWRTIRIKGRIGYLNSVWKNRKAGGRGIDDPHDHHHGH